MDIRFSPDTLYYGDCLEIMQSFPTGSVDLICFDPPFNSNQKYHAIFKKSGLNFEAQIKAFDDMWLWNDDSAQRVRDIKNAVANPASKVIAAFELCIPETPMLSYTSYMAQRLFEMHRILKKNGSIYLHCDQTASHYLKLVMDSVFGVKQFQNDFIWYYSGGGASKRRWARKHDNLLFYTKSGMWTFNIDAIRTPHKWTKGQKRADGSDRSIEGKIPDDVFVHHYVMPWASENLGYPTQKPIALYERIIKASSNSGDVVLDPFAGCGTTIEAARKNNRKVVGIDILPFALRLINVHRLIPNGLTALPVQGIPVDMDTAHQLAKKEPLKFQDWAISLIDGFAANPKKVGDDGIDGFGMFFHTPSNMDRKAIVVQVTGASGSQRAKYDRLQATIRNTNAAMGVLITLDEQTAQRNWSHTLEPVRMGETTYSPIQCFSIKEYYANGERYEPPLRLPPLANPWTGKEMQKTLFD